MAQADQREFLWLHHAAGRSSDQLCHWYRIGSLQEHVRERRSRGSVRDRRYDESRSATYLSHDVVGYEDLDDYGDWRNDSNYGHVWFPNRVAVGWAPYHEGHWDWISPWGYTWVDDSPWGYAPFHYGRWVTIRGRWGWVAGPVAVGAVYAPALVVFIGGGGVGVGLGANVGWFPLGPDRKSVV